MPKNKKIDISNYEIRLLTVDEVAYILGMSPKTLRHKLIYKKDALPFQPIPKKDGARAVRFRGAEVKAYVDGNLETDNECVQ